MLEHRQSPIAPSAAASHATPTSSRFEIRVSPPAARISLRCNPATMQAQSRPAEFDITQPINRVTTYDAKSSLRLGPDEWLLIDHDASPAQLHADLHQALSNANDAPLMFSIVDVSHRFVGLDLSGGDVRRVLNAVCPRDLHPDVFPIGSATRTVLAKSETILMCPNAESEFHLEIGRSFARYVHGILTDAAKLQFGE